MVHNIRIGADNYGLSKPIPVRVEYQGEGEFVARFADAHISRSGDTMEDAIAWLQSSIVTLYEHLSSKSIDRLGPLPLRQLEVLRGYLGPCIQTDYFPNCSGNR